MMTEVNPAGEAADGVQEPATPQGSPRITDTPDVPEYLSVEWWQLPVDDWRRQASIVVAANKWAAIAESAYGPDLLAEAIDWHRRMTFSDWSSAVSEMVKGRTLGPSYRELERRRAVVGPLPEKVAQRFGGPYTGGAVDWATGRPVEFSSDNSTREAA